MKAKRHTPKFVYDEVYLDNYYISYGVPFKDYIAAIKRLLGVERAIERVTDGRFMVFEKDDGGQILWIWTSKRNPIVLAHECLHAITYVLEDKLPLTVETSEAYCYLLQMLMRKALEK